MRAGFILNHGWSESWALGHGSEKLPITRGELGGRHTGALLADCKHHLSKSSLLSPSFVQTGSRARA